MITKLSMPQKGKLMGKHISLVDREITYESAIYGYSEAVETQREYYKNNYSSPTSLRVIEYQSPPDPLVTT